MHAIELQENKILFTVTYKIKLRADHSFKHRGSTCLGITINNVRA